VSSHWTGTQRVKPSAPNIRRLRTLHREARRESIFVSLFAFRAASILRKNLLTGCGLTSPERQRLRSFRLATLPSTKGGYIWGYISATFSSQEQIIIFCHIVIIKPSRIVRNPNRGKYCHVEGMSASKGKIFASSRVDADYEKILWATELSPRKGNTGTRTKTGYRCLWHSLISRACGFGMRSALEGAQSKDGNLFIYTQKTGTPVKIPLPSHGD